MIYQQMTNTYGRIELTRSVLGFYRVQLFVHNKLGNAYKHPQLSRILFTAKNATKLYDRWIDMLLYASDCNEGWDA